MYSTYNEGKSVIAKRFKNILKAKTYKKWQLIIKNLDEKIQINRKAPKFKVNDRVRITKSKNIFRKLYTENWSNEIFIINSASKNNP